MEPKQLTFAADGLYTLNHFLGGASWAQVDVKAEAFQDALKKVRGIVTHSLYHEWRLWFSVQLIENLLQACVTQGKKFIYVEAGVGECHTIMVLTNYLRNQTYLATNTDNGVRARYDLFMSSRFILMDTFSGVDSSLLLPNEQQLPHETTAYGGSTEKVVLTRLKSQGLEPPQLTLIKGSIPMSLSNFPAYAQDFSFLHVDMNNITPEIAALQYFMPLQSQGSVILLDDYGFVGHDHQRDAINSLLDTHGYPRPINLPTGQGLILR
jgi:hypothetical protein